MRQAYQNLQNPRPMVMPKELEGQLTRIDENTVWKTVSAHLTGVIIFHPGTQSFYSTVVMRPQEFYKKVTKQVAGHDKLALALRRLLERHPDFEFYCLHPVARRSAEHYLVQQRYQRVATGIGEMMGENSCLFSITCPEYNFTRWIIAPKDTEDVKIVKKANESINNWLKSKAHEGERIRLRDGLGKRKTPDRVVFGDNVVVKYHHAMQGPARNYPKFTQDLNFRAVQEYLAKSTGAVNPSF